MGAWPDNIIPLKTKLSIPGLPDSTARHRLNKLFKEIRSTKLITIVAGAGYGKTTVAAQACRQQSLDTVWYCLDGMDRNIFVFIHYLVAGIRKHYKNFGEKTLKRINTYQEEFTTTEQLRIDYQSVLMILLNEMEQIVCTHLAIVLDDFHLIQEHRDIDAAIKLILKYLPPKIHLIVVGRKKINLDLSNLISKRDAFEITEKDLMFDLEEMDILYKQVFNISLQQSDLELLRRKTGGWAAGLVLFQYRVRNLDSEGVRKQLSRLKGDNRIFGEYLETNIFNLLPADTRSFLINTSILSNLETSFCNQLLGIGNSKEILSCLEKSHLFTFSTNENHNTYCYHHLFRDYLEAQLRQQSDESIIKKLHSRAALLWAARGEANEAIHHYIEAQEYPPACRLIVDFGEHLAQTGQVNKLLIYLEAIPETVFKEMPMLTYLWGDALVLKGKLPDALLSFESARKLFETAGDLDNAGRCLMRAATIYYIQGDYTKAEGIFREFIERVEPGSDAYFFSLGSLIFIAARTGDVELADNWYETANTAMAKQEENHWSGFIFVNYAERFIHSHEFDQAIHYGRRSLKIAARFKCHLQAVKSCHLLAKIYLNLGEYDQSCQTALEGIRISEKYGFLAPAYANCLIVAGLATAGLGHFSRALSYCRTALTVCEQTECDFTEAMAYYTISTVYRMIDDFDGCEVSARRALAAIERTAFDHEKQYLTFVLARILLEKKRTQEAVRLIESIDNLFSASPSLIRRVFIFHMRLNWMTNRVKDAKSWLCKALDFQPPYGKDFLLINEHDWIVPLLAELHADQKYQREIESLLPSFDIEDLEVLNKLSSSKRIKIRKAAKACLETVGKFAREALHIQCLGVFTLYRGEAEIASDSWRSGKAKLLFKYLAYQSSKGYVSKDQLLELLWPDQNPSVTVKRLHVALTAIRKTIEPELASGKPSTYLLRNGDTYRLDLGHNGYMDVAAFDQTLTTAAKVTEPEELLRLYLKAEAIYQGPLFEEDPYEQWCMNEREHYQQKYLNLLSNMADLYCDMSNPVKGIEYLRRALTVDAYSEDIYCRLMDLYHQIGNRFMAIKTYELCKRKMESDFECPLSDETKRLYLDIISA